MLRLFLAMHHFTADKTHPARSDLFDHIGATHNANHSTLIKYRQTLDAFMYENMIRLFQLSVRSNANDTTSHDITDRFSLLGDDIVLGNNTH